MISALIHASIYSPMVVRLEGRGLIRGNGSLGCGSEVCDSKELLCSTTMLSLTSSPQQSNQTPGSQNLRDHKPQVPSSLSVCFLSNYLAMETSLPQRAVGTPSQTSLFMSA